MRGVRSGRARHRGGAQPRRDAEQLDASRGGGVCPPHRVAHRAILCIDMPVFAIQRVPTGRRGRLPESERLVQRVEEDEGDLPRRGLVDPVAGMPRCLTAITLVLLNVRLYVRPRRPAFGVVLLPLVEVDCRVPEFRQQGRAPVFAPPRRALPPPRAGSSECPAPFPMSNSTGKRLPAIL